MIKYTKRGTLTVFYYLLMVDGDIAQSEQEKFIELGNEIDSKNFKSYKKEIEKECAEQIKKSFDDEDYYDVIVEGVDKALSEKPAKDEEGILSRLLLWNMLVLAFADRKYQKIERRLIRHVVRKSKIERSILLEMEHLIRSYRAIEKEENYLSKSTRPYSEIAPLVEELKTRKANVMKNALNLVNDESMMTSIKEIKAEPDVFDTVGGFVAGAAGEVGNFIGGAAAGVGEAVGGFFGGVAGMFGLGDNKNESKAKKETKDKK